jgi:NAD(P)-dependent dehydrogenase (short-subunit alcohol dehydrogenase family)
VTPPERSTAPQRLAVLVTGATGPAGRAVAERFVLDGHRVAVNSSDPGRVAAVVDALGARGGDAIAAPGDLRHPGLAAGVVGRVTEVFGRIDVVAHLVGGWTGGTPVEDLDHDEVRRMLDQHLWTTLNVLQPVLPGMRERRFGRLIAVTSPLAATPGPRGASYAIAKSAQEILFRSVAREAAADGVGANLLVVRTIDDDRSRSAQPNARTANWTTPEEVAEAVAWLASPAADAVNGARIPLDGRS